MPENVRPFPAPPGRDRLESWKEIAAYLGREVRTVQGWEKSEELPVHRHRHSRLATVFAFQSELDAWRTRRAGNAAVQKPDLRRLNSSATPARVEEPPRQAPCLVGRQKERNALHAALRQVESGRGLLVSVTGEPGMGKTTLVEEFCKELEEPTLVARGKCSERLAGSEAYLPWLESLESLLRQNQNQAAVARLMKTTAPTWYAHIGQQDSSKSAARLTSQERMKRELTALFEALSLTQPIVVLLEDLHWADASTVDILVYMADHFDRAKVLVIVTYRPAELQLLKHPFLQVKLNLLSRGLCREMPIEFLSRSDIQRYLDLSFPEHRFPSGLADLIHSRTEGSPLFMADLVRYLWDRGVLNERDGWQLAGSLPALEREMPESVRAMVERKIALLEGDDRGLLVAASVHGFEFDSTIVSEALEQGAAAVEERLEMLDRVHALVRVVEEREFPDRTPTLRYRFVHVLYQNALYASLQPTRRAALCASVAQVLVNHHGEEDPSVTSQLAHLYEGARNFLKASSYFQKAAKIATSLFAYREASALARHGLELLNRLPESPGKAQAELALQVTLGEPLQALKGYASPEVEQVYLQAKNRAEDVGDDRQLGLALYGLGMSHLVQSEFGKAVVVGEQFLALCRATGRRDLEITACGALEGARLHTGNFSGTVELFRNYESVLDQITVPKLAVIHGTYGGTFSRCFAAWALWFLGYPDQAHRHADVALVEARKLTHIQSMASALAIGALVYSFRRDVPRTHELVSELLTLAEEHDLSHYRAFGTVMDGWTLTWLHKPAEGLEQLRRGREQFRANASRLHYPHFSALMAEAYCALGDLQRGLAVCDDGIAEAARTGGAYYEPEVFRLKGELLRTHAPMEAEALFREAAALARKQGAKATELRAAISLARMLPVDETRAFLKSVYEWFHEGFETADLQEARVLLDRR